MGEERTIRLLIVEDNVADVLLMREAIRELCPCPVEIRTVSDGEQALSILKSGLECDVIILDLSLPKMDGHAFLERYKSHYPPVVIFSSSWNEADSKRALSLGAREFIRKPGTYDGYVESVCGIIEKWGSTDNPQASKVLTELPKFASVRISIEDFHARLERWRESPSHLTPAPCLGTARIFSGTPGMR